MRVSLSEKEFDVLVNGGVVTRRRAGELVEICLQDIGFDAMATYVYDAAHRRGQAGHFVQLGIHEGLFRLKALRQKRIEERERDA